MFLWKWMHVVMAMLIAVTYVPGTVGQSSSKSYHYGESSICQRMYIRNEPSSLKRLENCEVIEGSLQIAMISANSSEAWKNHSYPKLREITGYLLLFDVANLTSLRNLFPNLAVIRGQELIDTHALIVMHGNELQEIGLPSLTNIQRGSVWIADNPHLCYVDTIEWSLIANESSIEGITKNKPFEQCPNLCNNSCPSYDTRRLCWSNKDCQKVFKNSVNGTCPQRCNGRPCMLNTENVDGRECCSPQCLGGCRGTGPTDCFVCKNVTFNKTCLDECPAGLYEYLNRRCLTEDECLKVTASPDVSKGSLKPLLGKLYEANGKKMCVLTCPVRSELAKNNKTCVPCQGTCKKVCQGMSVDTVEKARELAGCTRINGGLKISIRRRSSSMSTKTIVKELKENLGSIEEIDHYLVITHTYAIFSLDFLENLKLIRGLQLENTNYSVQIRSNENLMELWDSKLMKENIKIENKNSIVMFHYNPKLCPSKIGEFLVKSGIKQKIDDRNNIGITNGDKVTCNTQILNVEIQKKTNNSVLIRYENFRRNLTVTSHLLSYEIHYKEAPDYPRKKVSKFDDRDPCGDDDWTILEYPKISDAVGSIHNEPEWEHSRLIVNLKHFAYYALYVKTIVIPDENSLNNNLGAESNLIYFQTLPGIPTRPQDLQLVPSGPDKLKLTWVPPHSPNGKLKNYIIYLQKVEENQNQQDQRNFCEYHRSTAKLAGTSTKSTIPPVFHPIEENESVTLATTPKECCSCSAGTKPTPSHDILQIQYLDNMRNEIMNRVFIANPAIPSHPDERGNDIRVKRSIFKRSTEDSGDNSGDSSENGDRFPGENNSPSFSNTAIPPQMIKVAEVDDTGLAKYSFELIHLNHFTTYYVAIQACRLSDSQFEVFDANSTDSENDTTTCSELQTGRTQTQASETADNINANSISINVTENNWVYLSWAEPSKPNGVVLAYVVKVQKWVGGQHDNPAQHCITRKSYEVKKNFTFPAPFGSGNYSVSIQVASLAKDSEFTAEKYFFIEDTSTSLSGIWALIILLPVFLMITIGAILGYYYVRSRGWVDGRRIFSANPEYMSNVDIPEEWEVPRNKLKVLEKELGQGSFGTVFEGLLRDFIQGSPLVNCAVKTVSEDTSSEDRALFLKEAALMVKLDCHCHHVVKLLGVISKSQPTYVVMELMALGDLKNYLRSRRPGTYCKGEPPPTLRQILRMAAEISDGMAYIHKHKLVHRDLAARNCMVGEDMNVKVGDFGMTKEVIQNDYYRKQTRGLLPVRWMAPESLCDGVFTNQTDVWSFGVVLWEMATLAAQPYQGLGNIQVLEYVQSGRTMERPENCPDVLYDLMTMCWRYEPRHRPTFLEILDQLTSDLDPSFAQVSFYHSPDGKIYRDQAKSQNVEEELITIRTPLRAPYDMSDDDLDDYDTDEDANELNHHIIDDLSDTVSRPLFSSPPTATVSSRNPLSNGLALNPRNIHSSRSGDNLNLVAATGATSSTANPYSTNYSPRPRTNSNNNNTNPRLPISPNLENSLSSNVNVPATSCSSLSSTNFTSSIPNGVESSTTPFHPSTSSSKCSLSPTEPKVDPKKVCMSSTDNLQALMINYPGDKISNGNSGNNSGNGYIIRRNSPISENQPVNRTTQC